MDGTYGFDDVTVAYHGHPAVRDVSLDLPAGRVTALVGGDGAGKTTLLRCLAGRLAPSSGRVRRADVRRTGVLAAGPPGWDELTVAENLAFAARVWGLSAAHARERTAALLDATGLRDATDRLASQLSGGMRRKLGFALATLHEPELLLLDEPTTGIDPVSRIELWRLMATAARDGGTVVLATTYLDEAERCTRVLALDGGDVLTTGAADEIIDRVRGALYAAPARDPRRRSWRRGATWRVFAPGGAPADATPVEPDLEDAVMVAMLERLPEAQPLTEAV
jgi:ABC-2 type transport system ATP-binding protein